ncbi:MAG: hypothetical protein ACTSRI_08400 [Promethearchaeota archaeon]
MVIGLAIFSWDQKIGAILDVKYPDTLEISESLINKIYMTHAYEQDFEGEELIEINYNEQCILSFCDKTKVAKVGYEILVLIFHEREKLNIYELKSKLLDFGKEIFQKSKDERNNYLLENKWIFFKKTSAKKILLLGRAGIGKTSIKQIIFEGKDPKNLLYNPLEPTRGITPSVYSWLDLKLGLFDSSGQELNFLLDDKNEQALAFENTDVIIYIFDFPLWVAKSQEIINEILKIVDILKKKSYNSKLVLFLHKIDLIGKDTREKYLENFSKLIKKELNFPVYFTSIYPELIYSIYNAFYEILGSFSDETRYLKKILDGQIKDFSKLMCFILNKNNSIIVQAMSKDFNTILINYSHKLIVQINQTFKDMVKNDNIDHLIISSSNKLNIIMNDLNHLKLNLSYLICVSEKLNANELIRLAGEIKSELNNFYYFGEKKKEI